MRNFCLKFRTFFLTGGQTHQAGEIKSAEELRLGDHLNREEVQLWLNSLNSSAGLLKNGLTRLPCLLEVKLIVVEKMPILEK